jgi:hypothetical protein
VLLFHKIKTESSMDPNFASTLAQSDDEDYQQVDKEAHSVTNIPAGDAKKQNQFETMDQFTRDCEKTFTDALEDIKTWALEIKHGTQTFETSKVVSYMQADALKQAHLRQQEWITHVKSILSCLCSSMAKHETLQKEKTIVNEESFGPFGVGEMVSVKWPSGIIFRGWINSRVVKNEKVRYCVHYSDGDTRTYTVEKLIQSATRLGERHETRECTCLQ